MSTVVRLPGGAVAEPGDIACNQVDCVGPRHSKVLDHCHRHMTVLLFDLDMTNCSPEPVEPAVKPRRYVVEVLLLYMFETEVR
ncbi:hypothetical protein EON76_06030 [bacterium]|nr:MAG: hypothetical protein EON76_06030 [bacterium]